MLKRPKVSEHVTPAERKRVVTELSRDDDTAQEVTRDLPRRPAVARSTMRDDTTKGPQIYADGVALVGRTPSELEQWIVDRAGTREPFSELFYANLGEPGSRSLGVVIGVQRAGDRLLTRPGFLPTGAMDAPVSFLPSEAWAPY